MFFHRKAKGKQRRVKSARAGQLVERTAPQLPAPPTPEVSDLWPANFVPAELSTFKLPFLKLTRTNLVTSAAELAAAVSAEQPQITLGADIVLSEPLLIDHDLTLDLGGFGLLSDQTTPDARVLDILHGSVTITGTGKIFTLSENGVAIRIFGAKNPSTLDYSALNIASGVRLYTPDGIGILVAPNLDSAYGLTINLAGEIIARTGISVHSGVKGAPIIRVLDGASIVADATSGQALDAAGSAIWEIGAATLSGYSGLQAYSGQFDFVGTQIYADGPAYLLGNLLDTASASQSAPLDVRISGGEYHSHSGITIIGRADAVRELSLRAASFFGPAGIINQDLAGLVDARDCAFETAPAAEVSAEAEPAFDAETSFDAEPVLDTETSFGAEPAFDAETAPAEAASAAASIAPAAPFAITLIDELAPVSY